MKSRDLLFFLLLSLLICDSVNGALLVDKAILVFDEDSGDRLAVFVLNDDEEEKLYVQVETFKVEAPGTLNEELVALDNRFSTRESAPEFVVTPNKLIVPPGGRNIVRLLNLNPSKDAEKIYRINFVPIVKPIELEEAEGDEGVRSMLEIVIAYQVLAIVLPEDPSPEPVVQRDGTSVKVENTGNSNFLLRSGKQCNPAVSEECVELPGKRIYPGNTWEFSLPYDGPFSFEVSSNEGNSSSLFP